MLELWGMQNTPSLLLLPGSHWSGVVAPNRVQSVGQIEFFDIWTELFEIKVFNYLTVCKQIADV